MLPVHQESKPKEEPAATAMNKIGIISVRKIFQSCKRNEKYRLQAKAEQEKAVEELQQLRCGDKGSRGRA